ncbi:DUF6429 family protein [Paracoccus fontiphilus]|uniref:DUF6429 family protein n=1 Tax=Paracoccus fontiphilus TaxID=1815556 RepID=A0ABV7ILP6_9RHOB|nr:DUF6429 family protein [Paracoccus fontiphilus]
MEIDRDKIDEAVLALLWLTLHDEAKSVILTDEGLRRAEELFRALFTRPRS